MKYSVLTENIGSAPHLLVDGHDDDDQHVAKQPDDDDQPEQDGH